MIDKPGDWPLPSVKFRVVIDDGNGMERELSREGWYAVHESGSLAVSGGDQDQLVVVYAPGQWHRIEVDFESAESKDRGPFNQLGFYNP